MCLVGEQLIVEHFCALSSLSRTCNDIITSVKNVGFLWCIITHNPIDHIIWTNYSKCSPKQRLYLLHINPVWISGLWLHFNTEGTTWISGSEHNWSWEKKKAAGEQRETLEPLAFPSLRVVFTTETIQKSMRAAQWFVNRGVVSQERERESKSERQQEQGEWA